MVNRGREHAVPRNTDVPEVPTHPICRFDPIVGSNLLPIIKLWLKVKSGFDPIGLDWTRVATARDDAMRSLLGSAQPRFARVHEL